ncbi:MAG: hypothetical protein ACFNYI_00355 [Eubacterium sp.]
MKGEKVDKYIDGKKNISAGKLKRIIDGSQKTLEEQSVASREQSVRYDEILRRQRSILYDARDRILDHENIGKESFRAIVRDNLNRFLDQCPDPSQNELNRYVLDNLSYEMKVSLHSSGKSREARQKLLEQMTGYADRLFEEKKSLFSSQPEFQEYVRKCVLHALDEAWIEEVDYLQQLQYATSTRGTAQRNPVFEYSREAFQSFDEMKTMMKKNIARNFFLGDPQIGENGDIQIVFP